MCKCEMKSEISQSIQVSGNEVWIYECEGEFLTDFKINFCPFCGENVQPERSKREDVNSKKALMNNPFIKEFRECFIQNDDAVL